MGARNEGGEGEGWEGYKAKLGDERPRRGEGTGKKRGGRGEGRERERERERAREGGCRTIVALALVAPVALVALVAHYRTLALAH